MESSTSSYLEAASTEIVSSDRPAKATITHQLKVLHICQRDDPAEGGAVRVAVEYVKLLPQYNVNAHCLFLYGDSGVFQKELGDRAHYLKIPNSSQFFKFWRLIQFIIRFKPDIIHHHDGLLWSHILTFFHPGIVKVAHAHLGANNLSVKLRGLIAAWVQRKSTDLLICITQDTQKSQIEIGSYKKERTQVIYNGVDSKRFYPPSIIERQIARSQFGLPQGAILVGFVGRLDCYMKGADDFLKTFALLPSNFWAMVVGEGGDRDYLQELAKKLQITERVIFTGLLEQTTVAYHTMDVFCLTSHWEPFGLVVAEAMACQVPVVGFECSGGVRELLTVTTGILIPQRNHKLMADTIIDITNNIQDYLKFKTQAHTKLQQNHDWTKNTAFLTNLYYELTT